MTRSIGRLRELPLRTKVLVTAIGAGVALVGGSTYLSFRYWKQEALASAEQQALMAGASARTAVESALRYGREEQARRTIATLVGTAPVLLARAYAADGTVVLSSEPDEEGSRIPGLWIPAAADIPGAGLVRATADQQAVRAFLPMAAQGAGVFEIQFSVEAIKAAMDRGTRLGVGLFIGSLLALLVIVFTMLEREVVAPVRRVAGLLSELPDARGDRSDLDRIEASVVELLEKERAAERSAAEQRRRLAEQAGFAQVGEMAAEMAHEFKRPLASVRTALDLLEQEYLIDGPGRALLEGVEGQLERLGETMRDVFALARPAGRDTQEIDLGGLVDGALMQLGGHPAAASIVVERDYDDAVPRIWGDARRLEQAIANLLLNAAEAMPGGGRLRVVARPAGAGWVELEVADGGIGIPAAELEKVMKPFYSTKPTGTGLGLPLVARVVASHHGRISIESEPGRGTTVRVHLPVGGPPSETEVTTWPAQESSYSMTIS